MCCIHDTILRVEVRQEVSSLRARVWLRLEERDMKITNVAVHRLEIDAAPWYFGHPIPKDEPTIWEYPLLVLETDTGHTGFSMGMGANGEGRTNSYAIFDLFSQFLIGKDPLQSESIWQEIRRKNRHLYAHTDTLLGIVDVAIWDLRGKFSNLPIADLLGRCRSKIPSYKTASYFLDSPDAVFEEASKYRNSKFAGLKFNMFGGPEIDIPKLTAAREAVGFGFPLMLDASSFYSYTDALKVGHALEELDFHWFEEPVYDRQIGILKRLSTELRVPILATETGGFAEKFNYLTSDAIDIYRGDVMNTGGVTGLKKMFSACEGFGYNLEVHTASSPLLDMANLHVACSASNSEFMETHHEMYNFGLKGNPLGTDDQGNLCLPEGPGLGVELDWDWIENHTVGILQ